MSPTQPLAEAQPELLVIESTSVVDPKTGTVCDEAGVRERMGVPPWQVVDAMALTGDSSDNIPGVRGIGPRAAVALIEAFGDLEGIDAAGPGDGRSAIASGPGGLSARTRWAGPDPAGRQLFAELGDDGPLRWSQQLHAALAGA